MSFKEKTYDAINWLLFGCCLVLLVVLVLLVTDQVELTEIPAWLMDMGA